MQCSDEVTGPHATREDDRHTAASAHAGHI
jgi:hypothetical protein